MALPQEQKYQLRENLFRHIGISKLYHTEASRRFAQEHLHPKATSMFKEKHPQKTNRLIYRKPLQKCTSSEASRPHARNSLHSELSIIKRVREVHLHYKQELQIHSDKWYCTLFHCQPFILCQKSFLQRNAKHSRIPRLTTLKYFSYPRYIWNILCLLFIHTQNSSIHIKKKEGKDSLWNQKILSWAYKSAWDSCWPTREDAGTSSIPSISAYMPATGTHRERKVQC